MPGLVCTHCGENCGRSPVIRNDLAFCCQGCSLVYQVLNEKKLGDYYTISHRPGIKVDSGTYGEKYAYLDHPDILKTLLEFSDDKIAKVSLFIPAIHCSSCIWLLENLQVLDEGVIYSDVNFIRKTLHLRFRMKDTSLRKLVELLHSIHYIPELNPGKQEGKANSALNRRIIARIGVAGFCFGNIMLLSFPDYLPGGDKVDQLMRHTFSYISFMLALPVVLYCSSDYFIAAWKSIRYRFINIELPISMGILALFGESSYQIFSGTGTGYLDSLAGLLFFMLTGKWYQNKSYQAMSFERDYKSYFPIAVTRIHEDRQEIIPLEQLEKGNRILIRNRELIPSDGILVKGNGNIDYSFVTGESAPVSRTAGEEVFAGGRQNGANLEIEVSREVAQSYLTRLWNDEGKNKDLSPPKEKLINRVSHYFTILIIGIAVLTATYWFIANPRIALYAFSSVLIVACPCALALTIPFTHGSVIRIFGRSQFYLKNAEVIEKLSKIDTVVFDKTGTITHNNRLKVDFEGSPLTSDERQWVAALTANSTHPASIAIHSSLGDIKANLVPAEFEEVPAMGLKGIIENRTLILGSSLFVTGENHPDAGLTTEVYISINNQLRGCFCIENTYREGLKQLIDQLGNHYDLHLLTGDNEAEKPRLIKLFNSAEQLHFRQSPEDKRAYIEQLQRQGHKVLMVGDGLNDAGALQSCDAGISISDQVYHFSPACDAILDAQRFGELYKFMRFTHTARKIIIASFVISFLYNIIGLSFAVQGLLSPIIAAILMPVSSITVVAFTTLATRIMASRRRLQ